MNWYFRGCLVCQGDLYEDTDNVGWLKCLLCGRTFSVAQCPENQFPLSDDDAIGDLYPEAAEPAPYNPFLEDPYPLKRAS
jgi:hypothetical protein